MTVIKNMKNQENREFWLHVESVAKEVNTWPQWMRSPRNRSNEHRNLDKKESDNTSKHRAASANM